MNNFKKYCPNVWIAECDEEYQKGDIIQLITKYGKEVDCKVFNLILVGRNGKYYYSIVRVEDQNYAERKAEKYRNSAENHTKKSNNYYQQAQEGREFLSLGEPIKVGHHSEKRHRALIERNNNRMGKCVEFSEKAEQAEQKVKYWENKAEEITLADPESLTYFENELEKAIEYHKGLKDGSIPRSHGYSLAYATKTVKDLKNKVEIAKKLWGE